MKIKRTSVLRNINYSFRISWAASGWLLSGRVLLEILGALLTIGTAYQMKRIINYVVDNVHKYDKIIFTRAVAMLIFYFALLLFTQVCAKLKEIAGMYHQELINNKVEFNIIHKINSLDISFFDNAKFYDEIVNATRDSQAIQLLTWAGVNVVKGISQLVACVAIIWGLGWYFPIFIVALNMPRIFMEKKYIKKIYTWQRSRTTTERQLNYYKNVLKNKRFAKDLRLHNLGQYFENKYQILWKQWLSEKNGMYLRKAVTELLGGLLPQISIFSVYLFVLHKIIYGIFQVGEFTYYGTIVQQFTNGISSLVGAIAQINENQLRLDNFNKFMNWEPAVKQEGENDIDEIRRIEFKNVSFRYPATNNQILKNISFVIQNSEKVALVGLNGAGKTTIINLLLRFYDPDSGEILINDVDIKKYRLTELRKCFGVVLQDFSAFALTIRENIILSDLQKGEKATDKEIEECCKNAGLVLDSAKYPNGLSTYVTKEFDINGAELSGGEKQKFAVANAFFQNSSCMILDEPSAALDPEAEEAVFQTLVKLCREKSALFITHRYSNALLADRILVISDGVIAETGTHEELINLDGLYKKLFDMQADRYGR